MLVFSFLSALFIILCTVPPLRIARWGKILISVLIAAVAFKFRLLHLFGGPLYFAPDLPEWILLSTSFAFTALFFFFALLAGKETVHFVLRIILWAQKRKNGDFIQQHENQIHLILVIFAVVCAALGILSGTAEPEICESEAYFPNLPEAADGWTVAVLSDLHAGEVTHAERMKAIVEKTNAAKPDLILLAGDFVDGTVKQREKDLLPLKGLRAPLGVYGVVGNHEYYSGYTEWMRWFDENGFRILQNEHILLGNGSVALGGVYDRKAELRGFPPPDVKKTFENLPSETWKLLLVHQPLLASDAEKEGVDFQISGHTHGGMIVGFDRLIGTMNGGHYSGYKKQGNLLVYVSNGAGIWNGFPIRIGVPSEISLIHLRRGTGTAHRLK